MNIILHLSFIGIEEGKCGHPVNRMLYTTGGSCETNPFTCFTQKSTQIIHRDDSICLLAVNEVDTLMNQSAVS